MILNSSVAGSLASFRRLCLVLAVAMVCGLASSPVHAQTTLYYGWGNTNISGSQALPTNWTGLSGTWNSTIQNWAVDGTGSSYGAWQNNAIANFGAVTSGSGTIVLTENMRVSGLSGTNTAAALSTLMLTSTVARTLTFNGLNPVVGVTFTRPDVNAVYIGGGLQLVADNALKQLSFVGNTGTAAALSFTGTATHDVNRINLVRIARLGFLTGGGTNSLNDSAEIVGRGSATIEFNRSETVGSVDFTNSRMEFNGTGAGTLNLGTVTSTGGVLMLNALSATSSNVTVRATGGVTKADNVSLPWAVYSGPATNANPLRFLQYNATSDKFTALTTDVLASSNVTTWAGSYNSSTDLYYTWAAGAGNYSGSGALPTGLTGNLTLRTLAMGPTGTSAVSNQFVLNLNGNTLTTQAISVGGAAAGGALNGIARITNGSITSTNGVLYVHALSGGEMGANLSGTMGVIVSSVGAITLNGTSTYTGAMSLVGQGQVTLGGSGVVVTGALNLGPYARATQSGVGRIASTSVVDLGVGSELSLGLTANQNQTLAGLTGSGTVQLGAVSTGTLTLNPTTSSTFSAAIAGAGNLALNNRNTFTLTGNNTFSGATAVNGGTLLLDYSANGNTADPLGTSAITLDMGTLVLQGKSSGATTETISALNMGANLGAANTLRLDANGGSGIALTVSTFGLATTAASTQNTNLVDLSSSSGNSLVASALSTTGTVINGVLMQWNGSGGRSNLVVRDSTGYGFATLSGATSGTLGRLTAGTSLTASSSSGTANYFLTTAGTLTRTASLDFSTLTIDSSAGNVTLAMGNNILQTSAGSPQGRGILVTGSNNVSITGNTLMFQGASGWVFNYSSGTLTLGQSFLTTTGGITLGGTGLTVWTGTNDLSTNSALRLFAEGIIFRPTANQSWVGTAGNIQVGNMTVSSGGVLEVGADLNGATAGDLSTEVKAFASNGGIQFYGDSGVSAFGGDRVVGFRASSGTGALQSLTWGTNSFLTQANGTGDGNFIFKLSSARSDSLVTVQNNIALGSLVRTVEVADGSAAVDADLSGVLSGAGSLTKTGAGTLRLSGSNTFTGLTTVASGMLTIGNGGTSGSIVSTSTVAIASGAVLNFNRTDNYGGSFANRITGTGSVRVASGTLALSNASNDYTGGSTIAGAGSVLEYGNLNAIGTGTVTFTGAGSLSAGVSGTLTNNVVMTSSGTISNNGLSQTLGGVISGAGNVSIAGSGTTRLSNASNDYTGGSTIAGAGTVLEYGNLSALGTGTVTFSGAGLLRAGVSGTLTNNVVMTSSGTISNNGLLQTLGGVISGAGNVSFAGSGTTTLTGLNTYAGTTDLMAGTLLVNGTNSGSGQVNVLTGAVLGGTGLMNGLVDVAGSLAPGNVGATGLLGAGALSLGGSSLTTIQMTGMNPALRGGDFDAIDVLTGALTYGGDLFFDFSFGTAFGQGTTTFDIFNFAGSQSGNFASVTANVGVYGPLSFTNSGGLWTTTTNDPNTTIQFSQATGDVQFVVVPEPGALAICGIGVAVAAWRLRRRRA